MYVMRGPFYWSNWSELPTIQTNTNYTARNGAFIMGILYNTALVNKLDYMLDYIRTDDSYNRSSGATYSNAHTRCIRDIKD